MELVRKYWSKWSQLPEFTNRSDYFAVLNSLERWSGCYSGNWTRWQKRLWIFNVTLIVMVWFCYWFKLYFALTREHREIQFFLVVVSYLSLTLVLGIHLIIHKSTKSAHDKVRAYINSRGIQPSDLKTFKLRQTFFRTNFWIVRAFYAASLAMIVFYYLGGATHKPEFHVEVHMDEPYKWVETLTAWITSITSLIISQTMQISFVFMIFLARGVVMEFGIVAQVFEELSNTIDEAVRDQLSKSSSSTVDDVQVYLRCFARELKGAVQVQQRFNACLRNFQKVMGPLLLLQHIQTMMAIAPAIFIFIYERGTGFEYNCILFAVMHALQYWLLCTYLEKLSDMNFKIGEALYNLPWHSRIQFTRKHSREYKEVVTSLLIALTWTRLAHRTSCGGVFNMTMEKFTDVMDSNYSFLTLLLNFK